MKPYKFTEEYRRKAAKVLVWAGCVLVALGAALLVLIARRSH